RLHHRKTHHPGSQGGRSRQGLLHRAAGIGPTGEGCEMLTAQEQFWRSDFGDKYTERNKPNWRRRVPFFLDMLHLSKCPRSILEVGCNSGTNLKAIRAIDPTIAAWGCEINQSAFNQAADAGLAVKHCSLFDVSKEFEPDAAFDLTMSVGVLIH